MQLKFRKYDLSVKEALQLEDEPYKGFFKERGIPVSQDLWLCDFGSWFCESFDANSKQIRKNSPTIILPVVDSGHFLYANQKSKVLTTSIKRSKKSVFIRTPIDWEKRLLAGEDQKSVVQQTVNVLAQSAGPHWVGYVTKVYSSSHHETVVFDDDFKTAREKNEALVFYVTTTAQDVYNKIVSDKKLKTFLREMPRRYNELCEIVDNSFKEALQISAEWGEKDADEVSDEECNDVKERLNAPTNAWFERYETDLQNVGITAAEDSLAKKINDYCAEKKLKIYDEPDGLRRRAFEIAVSDMIF